MKLTFTIVSLIFVLSHMRTVESLSNGRRQNFHYAVLPPSQSPFCPAHRGSALPTIKFSAPFCFQASQHDKFAKDTQSSVSQSSGTPSGGGMSLKIRTMSGKTIVLDGVYSDDSIRALKQKVEEKEGMPIDQQRLIAGGKQLEDHLTVQDYNISEGSVLHLVLRLRGGRQAGGVIYTAR